MKRIFFIFLFVLWSSIAHADVIFHDTMNHGSANDDVAGTTPDTAGTTYTELFNNSSTKWRLLKSPDRISPTTSTINVGIIYELTPAPSQSDINFELTAQDLDVGDNNGMFIIYRYSDQDNMFGVGLTANGTTKAVLWKIVAGVRTDLGTSSSTPADGDVFRLELRGDDHELFINNVSEITATDSALSANRRVCIGAGAISTTASTFEGWDLDINNDISVLKITEVSAATFIPGVTFY